MKQTATLKNFETCLPSGKSVYLDIYLERDEDGDISAECMSPGTETPVCIHHSNNEMMGWFDHADHLNLWEGGNGKD